MIKNYSFGHVEVDGKAFDKDIIIYPDGHIQASWWRKEGHQLSRPDIEELIGAEPELIIAGTGAMGRMHPDGNLAAELEKLGIDFEAEPTGLAVKRFNQLSHQKKVGLCLHLTC